MTQLLKTIATIRFTLMAMAATVVLVAAASFMPSDFIRLNLQPSSSVKRSAMEGLLIGLVLVVTALMVDWYRLERGERHQDQSVPASPGGFRDAMKTIQEFVLDSLQLSWMEADASLIAPSAKPVDTTPLQTERGLLSNRARVLVKAAPPKTSRPRIPLGCRKPAIIVNIADMRRQRG